jgi:hypothetical protein
MSDNNSSSSSIARVNYFDRQFLRTQDFTDEQAYHVAMRRRHNISHHTWGIVSGLEIVLEEGNFYVQPGMAVDGYGRELILPQRQPLNAKAFVDKGSKELDVWLVYSLKSTDKPPAGYAGCEESNKTINGSDGSIDNNNNNGSGNGSGASFYRWQETAQVLLEKADADFTDRRAPEGVAIADLNFDASRTPPDSPQSYWPLFLGQIINDPANQQQPLAAKLDDRPYVGLVGEAVSAPSGRARVQVGAERADDPQRFAVYTRDEGAQPSSAGLQPRLDIDQQGELSVRGDASIYGNLTMAGGAIEFEAGTARDAKMPPWNIYHLAAENNGPEELRIEMAAAPAGKGGNNQVVIGAWFKGPDETGQVKEIFHPCLSIDANCTVTVYGNLVVKGQITGQVNASLKAEGQLSADALSFAAGALMSGIVGTSAQLSGPSAASIAKPSGQSDFATVMAGGAPFVSAVADSLAADSALMTAFAERIKASHPDAAEELRAALTTIIKP